MNRRTNSCPACAVLALAVSIAACTCFCVALLERNTAPALVTNCAITLQPSPSNIHDCKSVLIVIGLVYTRCSSVIECPICFTGTNHVSSTRCHPSVVSRSFPQLSHVVIIVLVIVCPSSARTTCQRHAALGSAPFCCRSARQAQATAQRLRRLGRRVGCARTPCHRLPDRPPIVQSQHHPHHFKTGR